MEIPKLKTTITGIENLPDGLNIRLETTEERVNELEDQQKLPSLKNGKKNKIYLK